MSVMIKGVKMPMNCHECDALGYSDIVGIDCSEYRFDCRASCCPLEDVEPVKHGRWEFVGQLTNAPVYKCTVCKRPSYLKSDWCPRCGAKMDE